MSDTGGGREFVFFISIEETGGRRRRGRRRKMREVDSQAEKDAAEHPRQTDREEKVLEKNSMNAWSHAGSCSSSACGLIYGCY